MVIQYLLVAGVAVILISFLRHRNTLRFQAGKKILFGLFLLGCLASIIQPDLLSTVADWVGVGRGADLLLYILIVAFAFVSVNTYLKFKDYDERLTILARKLAVSEAQVRAGHGGGEVNH